MLKTENKSSSKRASRHDGMQELTIPLKVNSPSSQSAFIVTDQQWEETKDRIQKIRPGEHLWFSASLSLVAFCISFAIGALSQTDSASQSTITLFWVASAVTGGAGIACIIAYWTSRNYRKDDIQSAVESMDRLKANSGENITDNGSVGAEDERLSKRSNTEKEKSSDPVLNLRDLNTSLKISLTSSMRKNGAFNIPVAPGSPLVTGTYADIRLVLPSVSTSEQPSVVDAFIKRFGSNSRTTRIYGGAPLKEWFKSNYEIGDIIPVDIDCPTQLTLGHSDGPDVMSK